MFRPSIASRPIEGLLSTPEKFNRPTNFKLAASDAYEKVLGRKPQTREEVDEELNALWFLEFLGLGK